MLIELKDGDTVIIYGNADYFTKDYYNNMAEAMMRGLKDVKVFMASAPHDSIVVYRASPSAPVEEHDGWFAWDSAPRDGQLIDAWVMHSEQGNRRIPCVSFIDHDFFVHSSKDYSFREISEFGNPTHWRYPPKGPKA